MRYTRADMDNKRYPDRVRGNGASLHSGTVRLDGNNLLVEASVV